MNTQAPTTTQSTSPHKNIEAPAAAIMSWRVHPAAQRPVQAVLVAGFILVVGSLIFTIMQCFWFTVLAILLLVAGLNRFFFPSRFTIDEVGISADYPLKRMRHKWSELQRFVCDKHGGYLSTRSVASRLDAYRGIHLLFDEVKRADIIACIRDRMASAHSETNS